MVGEGRRGRGNGIAYAPSSISPIINSIWQRNNASLTGYALLFTWQQQTSAEACTVSWFDSPDTVLHLQEWQRGFAALVLDNGEDSGTGPPNPTLYIMAERHAVHHFRCKSFRQKGRISNIMVYVVMLDAMVDSNCVHSTGSTPPVLASLDQLHSSILGKA